MDQGGTFASEGAAASTVASFIPPVAAVICHNNQHKLISHTWGMGIQTATRHYHIWIDL